MQNNRNRRMRAILTAQQIHSHIHFLGFSSKLHNKTKLKAGFLVCIFFVSVVAVCVLCVHGVLRSGLSSMTLLFMVCDKASY